MKKTKKPPNNFTKRAYQCKNCLSVVRLLCTSCSPGDGRRMFTCPCCGHQFNNGRKGKGYRTYPK